MNPRSTIARLPEELRQEGNQRLAARPTIAQILDWVNPLRKSTKSSLPIFVVAPFPPWPPSPTLPQVSPKEISRREPRRMRDDRMETPWAITGRGF